MTCVFSLQQRGVHEEERKKLLGLKEKLKAAMGMGKHIDNRASMMPSTASSSQTIKTGYLLMKPRGVLLKL